MEIWGIVITVIVFIAIAIMSFAYAIHAAHKRALAIQEVAGSLGFSYTPKPELRMFDPLRRFQLFQTGKDQQALNLVSGSTDTTQVLIFDWRYVTGSGKHAHTHSMTIAAIQATDLNLPGFLCRPESLLDWLGLTFDGKDIDFPDQPMFSKKYHLHGTFENRVREYFDPAVCEFFEQREGLYVEGQKDWMLYCRQEKISQPENVRDLFQDAFKLYLLLRESPSEEASDSASAVTDQSRDEMSPEAEREF